jgi:hypothetical protein
MSTITLGWAHVQGYGLSAEHLDVKADVEFKGETFQLGHGSVVIAAITGCTNTSNPSVMLGAGAARCLSSPVTARGGLCFVVAVYPRLDAAMYIFH